jgi:hypothetical protein
MAVLITSGRPPRPLDSGGIFPTAGRGFSYSLIINRRAIGWCCFAVDNILRFHHFHDLRQDFGYLRLFLFRELIESIVEVLLQRQRSGFNQLASMVGQADCYHAPVGTDAFTFY